MAVAPLGSITNTYAHYVCGDADGSWYEASNWECQWNELWGCPCYYNVETGEMVWTLSETGAEVRRGGSSWVLPSDAACPDLTIGHHAPFTAEEQSPEEQPWDWEQHWSEQFNCSLYYDTKTKDLRFSPNDLGPPSLEEVAREVFGGCVERAFDAGAEHEAGAGAEEAGPAEESEALAEAPVAAAADEATAPDIAAAADGAEEVDVWSWQGCGSKLEAAAAAAADAAAAVATAPSAAAASAEAALGDVVEVVAQAAAEAVEAEVQDAVQARTAEGVRSQQGPASEQEAPEDVAVAVAAAAEEPAEAVSQPRTAESARSQQGAAPVPEAPEGAALPTQDENAQQRHSEEVADAPPVVATADVAAAADEAALPGAAAAATTEAEAREAEAQAAAQTRAPEGGESRQDRGSKPEVREVVAVPEHDENSQPVSDIAVAGAAKGRVPAPAARAVRPAGDGTPVPGEEACPPSEVMERFGAELERRRRDCERLRKVVMELAEKDQKMEVRAKKVNRIMEELRQHANERVEKVSRDMEELRLQHSAELAELRAEVRRFRHRNAELRQGSGKVSSPRKIISSIPRPLVNSSPRVPKRNGSLPRKGTVPSLVSSFSSVATAATRVLGVTTEVPSQVPSQPVGGRPSVRRSTGGEAGRSNGW